MRGSPRSFQRTWCSWKAGSREKGGGTPSSLCERALDLLAQVANIWPPPWLSLSCSEVLEGRVAHFSVSGLFSKAFFQARNWVMSVISGHHTLVAAAAADFPLKDFRKSFSHAVLQGMRTPSFWGSLETSKNFAFGHRRDTYTSLCFSKYSTRQNKLESPPGYFLPPCLQPRCPQACHSGTWRRRR